jgi:leader peptidase (prepilin peptidase)/N-methyltransferase
MSDLLTHPNAIYLPALVFGCCVGSFLNVVIHRMPRNISVVTPPSSCPSCGHRVRPWENVPVLAWAFLRGKCSGCGAPISLRYPMVELATGLLAVASLWWFGPTLDALLSFVLLASMLAVAFIDWEHMIIPDQISLGLLGLGLAVSPWSAPGVVGALSGALVGGGLLLLVGFLWEKMRGVEAMGGGDVKLMAAAGAFLGIGGVLLIIFFGAFLGAVVGTVMLRRGGQAKVAFGTFLAAATVIVVFAGPDFIDWYLSTLRPPA